jgi:hypothetical protein
VWFDEDALAAAFMDIAGVPVVWVVAVLAGLLAVFLGGAWVWG